MKIENEKEMNYNFVVCVWTEHVESCECIVKVSEMSCEANNVTSKYIWIGSSARQIGKKFKK